MPIPQENPIVVAPSPTPFNPDDSVNYDAVARNAERWLNTPLSGFVLNSENGEEQFLGETERVEIVRAVHAARKGQRLLIAGIDSPSVSETVRLAEVFAAEGADMVRIRIPRFGVDVARYFAEVTPRSPVPVIVIHQMAPGEFRGGNSAVGASPEVIGEAVSRDNVFGYIASGDIRFEAVVRQHVPADKRFWLGNGVLLVAGAAIGANGACLMFGNVAPKHCLEIIHLVNAGHLQEAQRMHQPLIAADWHILANRAAGIKAALELQGFEMGPPRIPSPPLSPETRRAIESAMRSGGLL